MDPYHLTPCVSYGNEVFQSPLWSDLATPQLLIPVHAVRLVERIPPKPRQIDVNDYSALEPYLTPDMTHPSFVPPTFPLPYPIKGWVYHSVPLENEDSYAKGWYGGSGFREESQAGAAGSSKGQFEYATPTLMPPISRQREINACSALEPFLTPYITPPPPLAHPTSPLPPSPLMLGLVFPPMPPRNQDSYAEGWLGFPCPGNHSFGQESQAGELRSSQVGASRSNYPPSSC